MSLILLALLFVVTAALARAYHAREGALAKEWSDRGNRDLSASKPAKAFEDYRNSLSYAPENPDVQLDLAEALLADGRLTEARSYLLNLWDHAPGSGEVNLDLAHLSMQMGDADQTIQYFRGAILGSWEGESASHRRKARIELSEFLLDKRRMDEAQAVVAGIAADTPAEDGSVHEKNGHLFLRVGDPARALAEFEAALQTDPHNSQWLAEAAQVAFEDGNYSKAETYFSRAAREDSTDNLRASLDLVRDILRNDPFLAGLSEDEQTRRTWRDFQQGMDRLRKCTRAGASSSASSHSSSDLDALNKQAQELQKRVNLSSLGRDSDLRNEAMQLVSGIEDVASQICGPPTGIDQALKLLKVQQEGINQ
ncbi:MAG TPA: tetratricopeptide repeat protein [Candidatus Acidoferrales bacterium]|jgi:Tfp pilus assembly protein PilF|nr:tetratricopeptide repeat protein [Candidatus Acidoferrales bacterium]